MSRLDVLVVGTRRPTVGGISSVVEEHIDALRAAGVEVMGFNTGRRLRRRPGALGLENIAAAVASAIGLYRCVRTRRPLAVAIHTVGLPVLPLARAIILVLASRAAGAPHILLHLHGYDMKERLEHGTKPGRLLLSTACRITSGQIVLSTATKDAMRDRIPHSHPIVVPNSIVVPSSPAADPAHSNSIVFVGTVGVRKGVDTLLEALSLANGNFEVEIIGGKAEEPELDHTLVVDLASSLPLTADVRLSGERDAEYVHEALRQAAIFVLPSRAEAMPMALVEAMAFGLPTVVTDIGAMGKMVREARCGYVVPVGDAGRLAEVLSLLMARPDERREFGRRAHEWARIHLHRAGLQARLIDSYHLGGEETISRFRFKDE